MSGKSCSHENPNGVRRVVNGKTLAPRSQRKTKIEYESYMAYYPFSNSMRLKTIEKHVSLVFLD